MSQFSGHPRIYLNNMNDISLFRQYLNCFEQGDPKLHSLIRESDYNLLPPPPENKGQIIECVGWKRHSSLIFLMLLFTKPNIEFSGWLYQTKTHFNHIVYQPFSRVSPPSFTLYDHHSMVNPK